MKSKEALERLKKETQPNAYTLNHNDEDFDIIEQDLDRLETLEKENQELLVNKNVAQKIATKLKNDNDRLKNAIKILNRFVSLTKCKNEKTNKWEAHFMYSLAISVLITQQEYELLEEVLGND